MHRKLINLILIFLYIGSLAGCRSLKTREVAQYVPSLVDKKLNLKVGMELLVDSRPAIDKRFTTDIENVPEEVTSNLIEYFKSSGFLSEVHYPSQEDDDIVIIGHIRRFMWRAYSKAPTYIPLVNLYVYLGIPCKTAYGLTHISLVLKNKKTGQVIDVFDEYSKVANSYNLYEFKDVDFAIELKQSFKEVASRLKNKLKRKILLEARYFK